MPNTDKLINQEQGDDIIEALNDIKDALANSSIVGDTDISEIADGTLTGAVAEFDGDISAINTTLDGLGDAATKDVANTYNAESTDPISGQGVADAVEVDSLSDTTPYLYRKSPAIGTRVMENALVGASVVVNQLIDTPSSDKSTTTNGVIFVDNRDGSFTLSTSSGGATADTNINVEPLSIPKGHKVVLFNSFSNTSLNTHRWLLSSSGTNTYFNDGDGIVNIADNTVNLVLSVRSGDVITTAETKKPIIVDLTEYFGSSTIPDAAYTKEQSRAGSGIAWLKSYGFFTEPYYAYDPGSVQSVRVDRKEIVGKNQFNAEDFVSAYPTRYEFDGDSIKTKSSLNTDDVLWENTGGISGQIAYTLIYKYANTGSVGIKPKILYTDGTSGSVYPGNYQTYHTYTGTTQAGKTVDKIVTDYGSGLNTTNFYLQIEFGTTHTAYEPYTSETYPMGSDTLRGLFKLVGDKIVADGDVKHSDGTLDRNFTHLDNQTGAIGDTITLTGYKSNGAIICSAGIVSEIGTISGTTLTLTKAISDADFIYELATTTTEQSTPFTNPQVSYVGGTEEFVDYEVSQGNRDFAVPVGHQSEYKKLPPIFEDDYIQTIQERAENVIEEIEAVTPISGTATVTLLHEEDQGEDWIVGFTGEINGHFDTDHFDYFLTARYTHAYNTNTQILNMDNCTDGDYVNIWQTGTFDFGVDGGVTVDISVTATKLSFAVNCIGDSIFGIYSSSEPTGEVKYLITPANRVLVN